MRLLAGLLVVALAGTAWSQGSKEEIPKRFGLPADVETFPQATAKDALGSVIKAIDRQRIAYLMAHLADPKFVDERVKLYGGDFEKLVTETTAKLAGDPDSVKQLRRLVAEGEWQEAGETSSVSHKEIPNRTVFLKKIGNRWFLENRTK